MKKAFLFLISFYLSACVQLTPAGSRVQILTEDQRALVVSCKPLGTVSVSSEDALRNNTAALSGDTAIISHRGVGSTSIVHGDVFRCSTSTSNTEQLNDSNKAKISTTTEKIDTEYLRKSTLCTSKGGIWTSGQCVVPIE